MRKVYTIVLLLISFNKIYCQIDTINSFYFSSLKKTQLSDPNIQDVKLVQDKVLNDRAVFQTMFVKYKNDSKYWRIGKEFIYDLKNNRLGYYSNVDSKTNVLIDTAFSFTTDGQIASLEVYTLKYDSVISYKKAKGFWSAVFGNYYEKMPNIFKSIEYSCDRDTITERTFKYSASKGFVLNGYVVYYNNQMQVIKRLLYYMGAEKTINDSAKNNILIDSRDGKIYKTIKIGEQVWMAENLAHKPDTGNFWIQDEKYGYLYNFYSLKDVCPIGWHLPTKNDFDTLLNNELVKGLTANLVEKGQSGFAALFGGMHFGVRDYPENYLTIFWTSTESGKNKFWFFQISKYNKEVGFFDKKKNYTFGVPVRCIKD